MVQNFGFLRKGYLWCDKWTALSGPLPVSDFELRGSGFGSGVEGSRFRLLGVGCGVRGSGFRASGLVPPPHAGWPLLVIPGGENRFSVFGSRVSGFGFMVPVSSRGNPRGWARLVSGVESRVQGFRFRALGSGF